ncbi:protein phosphatase 1, regulatory (inhibitor) subunit 14Ab [Ictalurus punctatus]|uniref:Protein phosphatase 1 regulatory subunit 14A n=1 Tax=Ictalurus punctatus TaxID=7998 RepID=A0A2D0STH6_ICTPU|nr:protein phosphatase 1, regulatory (inhibitor) subunit 14Ab [Ictalurus punctatus]XP_053503716.1 protein phosphatase 1, regulatory (inhibitor) subunit 14Ab isoform X2 [Ictalurus furcatus]
MAANRVGRRHNSKVHSPSRGSGRESGLSVQKRQARVTVKYNRKELQRRLDVEKWIDTGLDELYLGREEHMPEEVNIDELLDLQSDEERTKRLQDILHSCNTNTEVFIKELVLKLHGLQKQEDLHNDGIEHPQLHIFPDRQNSANSEIL